MKLSDVLRRVRDGISSNSYPNETAVRTKIVQPILEALGWDVYDPELVRDEFSLKLKNRRRRIDMALCVSHGNPRCIVELKATGHDLKEIGRSADDQQLFEYSFHAGAPLALLTNGATWRFYSTQSAGTYEERLVRALDLRADPLNQVAGALRRYLAFEYTRTGRAADHAREDLNSRIDRTQARDALPRAWARLVENEIHKDLVRLMIETTHSLSEARPAEEDVAQFLRRLKPDTGGASRTRRRRRTQPSTAPSGEASPSRPSPDKVPSAAARKTARGVPLVYFLLGEEREARNAREAHVAIFTALAKRDAAFLASVAPKLRGRKNRQVARNRHDLSQTESMLKTAAQLPNGWWLLTHMSNSQKVKSLKIACEVAGLRFGDRSGLSIDLPNA